MTHSEESLERIVRIERPPRHFTMLRDVNGDYLGSTDGVRLGAFDHADDKVLWQQTETAQTYRHAVSGLTIEARADSDTRAVTVYCDGKRHAGAFLKDRGPAELPSECLHALREQGWVCLAAILDPATVAALDGVANSGCWSRQDNNPHTAPLNQNAAVASAAAEPVSLWIIRQYLQTHDISLAHSPSFAVQETDDGECDVQGWHTDFPYLWGSPQSVGGDRVPCGLTGDLVMGVQRNICISEFTRQNGATCFKLGSHRRNAGPPRDWGVDAEYSQPGFRRQHGLPYGGPEADVIEAPPGSIILYDARTWHRAGVNRTHRKRAALLQALTPAYVMPFKDTSEPYKVFVESDLVQRLNARERRELERLMVHKIVGPLGRHAITVEKDHGGTPGLGTISDNPRSDAP